MDEARFKELFEDVDRWILQARRLKFAGDAYTEQITILVNQTLAISPLSVAGDNSYYHHEDVFKMHQLIEQWRSLSDARALLYGLAIENACKAHLIYQGRIKIVNGVVKGLRTDHNVMALVKETGYRPTDVETEFLQLIGYQLRVLSKYPIAKDMNTQNQFTGRTLGARIEDGSITNTLILKVLKQTAHKRIFLHGKNET